MLKPLSEGSSLALLFAIGYVTTVAVTTAPLNIAAALPLAVALYVFGAIGERYGWFRHRWITPVSVLVAAAFGVLAAVIF